MRTVADLSQHAFVDVKRIQNVLIPLTGMNIHQHCPACRRHIRHKDLPVGKFPDQPGVQRTCEDLLFFYLFPDARHIVDDPANLCGREIRVYHQSGLLPDHIPVFLRDGIRIFGRASVLPHDRVIDRYSGRLVPEHHCFTLVVNTDAAQLCRINAGLSASLRNRVQHTVPDLHRIVLHPARVRITLREFFVASAGHIPVLIHDKSRGSRRSAVKTEVIFSSHFPGSFLLNQRFNLVVIYN